MVSREGAEVQHRGGGVGQRAAAGGRGRAERVVDDERHRARPVEAEVARLEAVAGRLVARRAGRVARPGGRGRGPERLQVGGRDARLRVRRVHAGDCEPVVAVVELIGLRAEYAAALLRVGVEVRVRVEPREGRARRGGVRERGDEDGGVLRPRAAGEAAQDGADAEHLAGRRGE